MTAITEHHFYGRRRNRGLHQQRQKAFDHVSAHYFVTATDKSALIDPLTFFHGRTPDDLRLEIGFGYGEHLTHQAALHPNVGFLGIEPFITGIAVAAIPMVDKNLTNIRIYPDDAMHLLPHFKPASFSHIYLFFPDPWPKIRHHKRRFIQPATVDILTRLLKTNGRLHIATDIPDLADWMTGFILEHPDFTADPARIDHATPPDNWVTTKYQQKAIKENRSSAYFDFIRR